MDNDRLIEKTVEITVAKLSGTDTNTTQSVGMNVRQLQQMNRTARMSLNSCRKSTTN